MYVHIHEPGADDVSRRVDNLLGFGFWKPSNGLDAPVLDPHIGLVPRIARAVENLTVPNQDVKHIDTFLYNHGALQASCL